MRIQIKDFLSLKKIDFEIRKGINLLVGKNGSGKTQVLVALAQKYTQHFVLQEYGYDIQRHDWLQHLSSNVVTEPNADLVFYREAIRKFNDGNKSQHYVTISPMKNFLNLDNMNAGYVYNVQSRFQNMYAIIGNIYVGGNLSNSKTGDKENWQLVANSFEEVFNKKLIGDFDSNKGTIIGIKLPDGKYASVNSLSTGELEFLGLICDLILERDNGKENELILIDELDSHFHPDLQRKVIKAINDLCNNKYLIITTHSPAVMQSVELDRIFYIRKNDECDSDENQVVSIGSDYELNERLLELYGAFYDDVAIAKIMNDKFEKSFYKFSNECFFESIALGEEYAKDSEPQTVTVRTLIQDKAMSDEINVFDVGCGKGRTYPIFKGLDDSVLKNINFFAIDRDSENLKVYEDVLSKNGFLDRFKSFKISNQIPSDVSSDFILMINLLHEVTYSLCDIINDCFKAANQGAKILICEVEELALGEKNFIMLHEEALKCLFENLVENNAIGLSVSRYNSHGGSPLLCAMIHVKNIENIQISNTDLIKALKNNIRTDISRLIGVDLSGRSHAFVVNNIANSVRFLSILEVDIFG